MNRLTAASLFVTAADLLTTVAMLNLSGWPLSRTIWLKLLLYGPQAGLAKALANQVTKRVDSVALYRGSKHGMD